jgi:uncharacterized membrane protein YbhN (UPF0104 family)
VPLPAVTGAYAGGVALNAVAPARGGDAVKVALVRGMLPGSSVATVAATMSVLVLFDMTVATTLVFCLGVAGAVPLDLGGASPALPLGGPWLGVVVLAVAAGAILLARLARPRVRALVRQLYQGGAILRQPGRYLRSVALPQALAWTCRVCVVLCLLAAFGLPASLPAAGLVMVLAGASTLVPLTPGGAGTQQLLITLALSETASAAAVLSFSVGMQAGVTLVNGLLGVIAAMVVCRTLRPIAAVRAALAAPAAR